MKERTVRRLFRQLLLQRRAGTSLPGEGDPGHAPQQSLARNHDMGRLEGPGTPANPPRAAQVADGVSLISSYHLGFT